MRNRLSLLIPAILTLGIALPSFSGETPSTPAVTRTVLRNMPERARFRTIALDGKVYAFRYPEDDLSTAGSIAAAGNVYSYDPQANTWTACAKLPVKTASYGLTALGGKIYVVGGATGPNTPAATLQEFDPDTNRWTVRKAMPTARSRMGVVVLGGLLWALGGKTSAEVMTDAVEVYDPVKDSWSARRSLSKPLMGVNAVAHHGRIYKLNGVQMAGGKWQYIMDFEAYDPKTDIWEKKAGVFDREPLDLISVGPRLFVMGGGAFTPPDTRSMREYDFKTDRWILRTDMPPEIAHTVHPSWTVLDGRIYTFGGGYRAGRSWSPSDQAHGYDPQTDRWEPLPCLSEKKISMGIATAGRRILLFGGEDMGSGEQSDQSRFSDSIEVYTIQAKPN